MKAFFVIPIFLLFHLLVFSQQYTIIDVYFSQDNINFKKSETRTKIYNFPKKAFIYDYLDTPGITPQKSWLTISDSDQFGRLIQKRYYTFLTNKDSNIYNLDSHIYKQNTYLFKQYSVNKNKYDLISKYLVYYDIQGRDSIRYGFYPVTDTLYKTTYLYLKNILIIKNFDKINFGYKYFGKSEFITSANGDTISNYGYDSNNILSMTYGKNIFKSNLKIRDIYFFDNPYYLSDKTYVYYKNGLLKEINYFSKKDPKDSLLLTNKNQYVYLADDKLFKETQIAYSNGLVINSTIFIYTYGSFVDIQQYNNISNNTKNIFFPNPAQNNLFIQDQGNINNLSILDIHGKVILFKKKLFTQSIDVSALPTGMYFLRFEQEGIIKTDKFLKE